MTPEQWAAERAAALLEAERLTAAIQREAGNDHALAALTRARECALERAQRAKEGQRDG